MGQGITIVGLGPGDSGLLTVAARRILRSADELYARTRRHPTLARLGRRERVHSFDDVYESAASLAGVYAEIARRVIALGRREQGVIYAVPGHPLVAEETVRLIRADAGAAGVEVHIVEGLSFIEPTLTLLGVDPVAAGLQVVDAAAVIADYFGNGLPHRDPFAARSRGFDASRPVLLAQVDQPRVASAVKIILLESYPTDHTIAVVRSAGVGRRQTADRLPLHDLDRVRIDHLTCVYVEPLPILDDVSSFDTLRHIVARLRAPGGCPWDREQTHASLVKDLVEETYEVVDAIERADEPALAEELGDMLLNVVLQAQIGEEARTLSIEDALRSVNTKLVRRHPHVFGEVAVSGTGDVLRNWDQIKRAEKGDSGDASRLGEIPLGLPSLAFAQKIQGRAKRTGFAWETLPPIEAKIEEELAELRAASPSEQADEFGDVLFMLVNYAQALGVNAEEALRGANRRFVARFKEMERLAAERAREFESLDLGEKIALWRDAKAALAARSGEAP